jgi:hypothetical protein
VVTCPLPVIAFRLIDWLHDANNNTVSAIRINLVIIVIVFNMIISFIIIPSLFIFNSLISLFDLTVSVIIETPFLVMVSYSRYHFDPLDHHCSLNILLYRPLLYNVII